MPFVMLASAALSAPVALTTIVAQEPAVPSIVRGPIDMATVPIQERADSAAVAIFFTKQETPSGTKTIAPVSSLSCQRTVSDNQSTGDDAITQLKLTAFRMGADAVVNVSLNADAKTNPIVWTQGVKCVSYVSASGIAVKLQ